MAEILDAVKETSKRLDAEPVLRGVELASSLLAWSLMAAAHRGGYDGVYEADNYTPLSFLLTMMIFHFVFVAGLLAAKASRGVEPRVLMKAELYGTAASCFFVWMAFVAGAASSTQLHDEFGGNSICNPHDGTHKAREKADYFCGRADASVAFTFFAACASSVSLGLVLKARGFEVPRPNPDLEESLEGSVGYNPVLKDPDGRTFDPAPFSGQPMEGIGASEAPPDAAVDL